MAADQQADVLALDVGVDLLVALLDPDGRLQPELLEDPLEHDANALGRLLGQHRRAAIQLSFGHVRSLRPRPNGSRCRAPSHHLRRFRFRGGGGGALVARTSSGVGTDGSGQTNWITACCAICQTPLAMK